ncbi:hypothetical protein SLA2020_479850 [Shorea laevis]
MQNVNTVEDPSGWRPYFTFYDSLQEKYATNEGLQDEKGGPAVKRKGRPRKQGNTDEQSSTEEDLISRSVSF